MDVIDLKSRKSTKIDSERVPDEAITDVLSILLDKHEKGEITDLLVGYVNQDTGNFETHIACPTDIAMLNLGADILKRCIFDILESYYDEGL